MTDVADRIIAELGLAPHPEGGWYRQTWQGPLRAGRASGTAILFLLKAGERSHWHHVDADEIWLWHAGAPLRLSVGLAPVGDGAQVARDLCLGPEVLAGQVPQALVPANHWQAAAPLAGDGAVDYTLVSCTVSPGFDFAGFVLAAPGFDLPRG